MTAFYVILALGVAYVGYRVYSDHQAEHARLYGVVPIGPVRYSGLYVTPGMPLNTFGGLNARV